MHVYAAFYDEPFLAFVIVFLIIVFFPTQRTDQTLIEILKRLETLLMEDMSTRKDDLGLNSELIQTY